MFKCFGGFNEVRLARDKNRQRIAFVDYENEASALYAMTSLKGFRFHNTTKGITVRFSENTKNNAPLPTLPGQPVKPPNDSRSMQRGQPYGGNRT